MGCCNKKLDGKPISPWRYWSGTAFLVAVHGGLLGGVVICRRCVGQGQRFDVRCLFMHRNTHIIDHVNDVFDLLWIDDAAGQVVIDLGVGQITLFLAAGDQFFQLLSLCARAYYCFFCCQDETPTGKRYKRLILLSLERPSYNYFSQFWTR